MRTLTVFIIFMVMNSISCKAGKKVVITGDFIGYKNSAPITCIAGYSFANGDYLDTIVGDINGHFTIELSIDQPHYFVAICKQDSGFFYIPTMIVKPGEQHSFICKLTNNNNKSFQGPAPNMSVSGPNVSVSGPNSEGQRLGALALSGMVGKGVNKKLWDFAKPETLIDSLNVKVQRAILPARAVFDAKKIDNDYYELMKFCISYDIGFHLAYTIDEMILKEEFSQQRDQLELIRGDIFNKYPVTKDYILNTLNFTGYVHLYINYFGSKNKAEYDAFTTKGLNVTYELSIVKKVLSKEAYKFYAQNSIFQAALKRNKEALDLLEQFKSEYPDYVQSKVYHIFEKQLMPAIKRMQVQ